MRFSVQSDLDRLSKKLTHQQKEQIPFATSLALNETAGDVSRAITDQMDRYFDNPTPFTKQAYIAKNGKWRGDRSNKKRLFVDIKPGKVQAEYLTFQIEGGTRRPHLKAILVPTRESPKNKYGNVPRATRKRIIAGKGKFFSAGEREEKTPGVYRRQGERITPMAFYVESAEYKAIFPIDKIAGGVVNNRFKLRFNQALKRALATAR